MPKRKNSRSLEEDIDHYKNKIKKLERKIHDRQKSASESEDVAYKPEEDIGADTPTLRPDDWLLEWPNCDADDELNITSEPQPGPSTATIVAPKEHTPNEAIIPDLDNDILEILGEDLSSTEKYGPEIRKELASRLLHIVKEGLHKETRKDLISKYPVPVNCTQIAAPKINAEIKAAITDTSIKRDRGIEIKQKQLASAIACLSELIHDQLSSTSKNNVVLQKLMDVSRILCDLQHADSVTRRNFILFSLKKDMTDHIKHTKIDTFLFGEDLAETLKSAKAVNKSGVELKADINNGTNTKYRSTVLRPVNRKAPSQARRPLAGPAPPAPRSRGPAAVRAQFYPLPPPPPPPPRRQPPHAYASRMPSQVQHATYPRRHY